MNLFIGMNCHQTFHGLSNNIGNNSFRYFFIEAFDEIGEGASVHVLNKHKERISEIISEVILDNVWRTAVFHNSNFSFDPV